MKLVIDPDLSCQTSFRHASISSSSHASGKQGLYRVEEGALPCRDLANQEDVDVVNPSTLCQTVGLDLILQLVPHLQYSFSKGPAR